MRRKLFFITAIILASCSNPKVEVEKTPASSTKIDKSVVSCGYLKLYKQLEDSTFLCIIVDNGSSLTPENLNEKYTLGSNNNQSFQVWIEDRSLCKTYYPDLCSDIHVQYTDSLGNEINNEGIKYYPQGGEIELSKKGNSLSVTIPKTKWHSITKVRQTVLIDFETILNGNTPG